MSRLPLLLLSFSIGLLVSLTTPILPAASPGTPKTAARLERGEPVRIVCFGDSVTGVYYHTGSRRAYTDMLGIALRQLSPRADVELVNAGISGNTTVNALDRIDRDVLAARPTLVTVMFGLNDMTRVSRGDYRDNLQEIVSRCRSAGAEVLLCTPNCVTDTSGRPTEKLVQYCDVVRSVGRELDVPMLDCYQQLDALRQRDPLAWRLLMSDAIHPNMDGHKRIAEMLAESITGRKTSLAGVLPPSPALPRTLAKIAQRQPIKVLAMEPFDALVQPALARLGSEVRVEVTPWQVAGKSLPEIEAEAKARVRAMRPDLVLIAVPRSARADSREALIHSFAWTMNWSLNFGVGGWDCLVIDASVAEPDRADGSRDALTRQLVRAQDLPLVERGKDDRRSPQEVLAEWMAAQR